MQDIHGLKALEIISDSVWIYSVYGLLGSLTSFGVFFLVLKIINKKRN